MVNILLFLLKMPTIFLNRLYFLPKTVIFLVKDPVLASNYFLGLLAAYSFDSFVLILCINQQ